MVRITLLSICIFIMLFVVGCDGDDDSSPSIHTGAACLFIANMTTLSVIDMETGEVANDVFGLGNAPNDMVIAGDLLVVVNSLSNDLNFFRIPQDGSLSPDGVVDVGIAQNNNPWAAASDGQGRLLITNMLQNSISVFSIATRQIEQTLPAGLAPGPIAIVGDYAYVANTGFDFATYTYREGSIWKYNMNTWQVTDSLQVGINPQDIQVDPLGRFHIVCTGNYADVSGEVWVVEPEPLAAVMTVETGGAPNRVAFALDSTAYLSAGGWSEFGIVLQYKYDTGEVLHGSGDPIGAGVGVNDIAISENCRIYVSCFGDNRVDELRADSVYASFTVGTGPSVIMLQE